MRFFHGLMLTMMLLAGSCSEPGVQQDANWSADTVAVNKMINMVSLQEIANYDTAKNLVLRASALARKINYPEGLAMALFEHGNLLYQGNRYREAMDEFTAALKMAKELNVTWIAADCLERMASIHLATDDPSLALKLYYDALALYEKIADSAGIAKVFNILGIYKTDTKEYDSALVYFTKAIAINEHIHQQYPLIENRGNLAYMYGRKGDSKMAELIFNELVDELTAMKDSLGLPTTYFNLAQLYQETGKFDTALIFLDKALRISEPVKDTVLLSTLYGNKGEILLKTGKCDSASRYLSKSVACAHAINDVETEAQALFYVLQVDSATGDYKNAFDVGKRIIVLKDTNARRQLRNNLKSSELKYENDKKTILINLQQQKIKSADREQVFYLVLFILSLTAGVLIGFVLVLERKNNRKNKQIDQDRILIHELQFEQIRKDREVDKLKLEKADMELKSKERELVCIAMGIEQKNEFLNDISKRFVKSLSEQQASDHVAVFNEIITSIKGQVNISGETDLFNQKFSAVHDSFYTNLKSAHPLLTKSELKFCAYLRLNVSGNQIASYLNITPEAIKKTRYRIRKKLNLSAEKSLEDYISRF